MIMTCICTTSTAISINGSLFDEFYPSRGIRQSDPISPYIFILCMEYLSLLIEQKCNLGEWKPLKASRNGPSFSHILFADDVFLFDEPSKHKLHLINWDTVCLPKGHGGLGIRRCSKLNEASIMKLIWRFLTLPSCPWMDLLRKKYSFQRYFHQPSQIWRAMAQLHSSFLAGTTWIINKGNQVNFLQDNWLPIGPINKTVYGPFHFDHSSFTVADALNFLSSFGELHCSLPSSIESTILSHLELVILGIQVPLNCPRCNSAPESPLHLIRDCPIVHSLWVPTSIPLTLQHSFHLGLLEWLKINSSSKFWLDHPKIPWAAFFSSMILNIWLDRNHLCFENSSNFKPVSCSFHPITWILPQPDWFKLNSDGSSNHTCTKAGAGGVIRDPKGNWIAGFAKNLGFGNLVRRLHPYTNGICLLLYAVDIA
ncbi:hypothetical protein SLEP1_g19362 [Rubroshorea leprosula]|nr:hypothetical protein SLEP1_g19362 [Rubroshorea leprosula]